MVYSDQKNNLLTVVNMSKQYQNVFLFDQVDFSLNENEVVLLTGNNGSGKTTFLKILAKLIGTDTGKVSYTRNSNIGYLPEKINLPNEKVGNFFDELLNHTKHGRVVKQLLNQYIDYFDLEPYLDMQISELSTGVQQKVALINALIPTPQILLLDNPFSSLSVDNYQSELTLFKELAESGSGIVITSHSAKDFLSIATEQYTIEDKNLQSVSENSLNVCYLYFQITPNSGALNKQMSLYIQKSPVNDEIILRVPSDKRGAMIVGMIDLGYQFKEIVYAEE